MKISTIRKLYPVTLSTVLVVVSANQAIQAYVMGEDNRYAVSDAEARLPEIEQTGLIDTGDGGYVTGILTGGNCDVVISAGHAAYYWSDNPAMGQRRGDMRGDGRFRFILAGRSRATDMRLVYSGYAGSASPDEDRNDWSVFRLSRPALPRCREISYTANAVACTGEVWMPAHHYDRRDTLLLERTCAIKDNLRGELLIHNCDSKDGSSGAPLYCREDAAIRLLGINISGVSWRELVDPGEYGKASKPFDYKHHRNYAVTIHGDFLRALEKELLASARRRLSQDRD